MINKTGRSRIYGGTDPRSLAAYTMPEASRYTGVPVATVRTWVRGRYYPTGSGRRFFSPLITVPNVTQGQLSFINLVEVHVLAALRRAHNVPLAKVRKALSFMGHHLHSPHPLAEQSFQTDGVDLFVEHCGRLLNVSQAGQVVLRELVQAYLRRVDWDGAGSPARLYPFSRQFDSSSMKEMDEQRPVIIDPLISFGRAVLAGTGIPIDMIGDRYKLGESIEDLAYDYRRTRHEIEAAIRCQFLYS